VLTAYKIAELYSTRSAPLRYLMMTEKVGVVSLLPLRVSTVAYNRGLAIKIVRDAKTGARRLLRLYCEHVHWACVYTIV